MSPVGGVQDTLTFPAPKKLVVILAGGPLGATLQKFKK